MAHPADDILARIAQWKSISVGTTYTVAPHGQAYGVKDASGRFLVTSLTQAEANAVRNMLENALGSFRSTIEQAALNDIEQLVQDWGTLLNG